MKKILQASLVLAGLAVTPQLKAVSPVENPWGEISDVFERIGQLGNELQVSLDFFSATTPKLAAAEAKMEEFATIRQSVKDCVTASYNSLKQSIADCLQNYDDQKIYYGGEISKIENDIQTLKALTDIEIAQLKADIQTYTDRYAALEIEYNTLKSMNQEAVDAALTKLDTAKQKFIQTVAQREIFSAKVSEFITKIYTEQGLTSIDLNELKDLICDNQ